MVRLLNPISFACCLMLVAQATATTPQAACPSLMQLSHGTTLASCEDSNATRDSIAPLPAKCGAFGRLCGIDWDYSTSWPCWLDTWASLKEGFIGCCLAGWHTNRTCESLAEEAFAKHDANNFPAGAGTEFCTEIHNLANAHTSWLRDAGASLTQMDQTWKQNQDALIVQTIAQRILAARENAASMFQHFAAGAVMLASGLSSKSTALALISSALARHLRGCDPNAPSA
eukprot:gb/GFBE01006482.1/.p1 GENE.gb/GFBE01006482.1/~~gb/GFBE01006482.1/.p1  ORF type:complete len:229 (+),score=19.38 gb/GFBE01006482.1/:1-687(+)